MMKAALILFLTALIGIVCGISSGNDTFLDMGRVLLFLAVMSTILGMVSNIATEPYIKQMLHRR